MTQYTRLLREIYWFIIILLLKFYARLTSNVVRNVRGLKIYIPYGVFSPVRTFSTELILDFLQEYLSETQGKHIKFCDMGTGTGIIAILAAKRGCTVVASDISKKAIRAAKVNAFLNDVEIDLRLGDLFSCYGRNERFDIIVFNPPYFPIKAKSEFSATYAAGEQYEVIVRFLKGAKYHLAENGFLLMTLTSLIDEDLILNIAGKLCYKVERIREIKGMPKEVISLYKLSLRS